MKGGNLNYIIAVFNSRSETLSFSNLLKHFGVRNAIVQTPQEVGRSCGISVKFSYDAFGDAKQILAKMKPQSFNGFFLEDSSFNSRHRV